PPVGSLIQSAEHGELRVVDRNLLTRTLNVVNTEGQLTVIPACRLATMEPTDGEEGKKASLWCIKDDHALSIGDVAKAPPDEAPLGGAARGPSPKSQFPASVEETVAREDEAVGPSPETDSSPGEEVGGGAGAQSVGVAPSDGEEGDKPGRSRRRRRRRRQRTSPEGAAKPEATPKRSEPGPPTPKKPSPQASSKPNTGGTTRRRIRFGRSRTGKGRDGGRE
ncbi:MAG TPA: hypothetical protein VM492_17460, partial [Sumerlaeia bacterium]|nr:hypothetical protein [Sumerlaeia bacterium]